MRKELVVALIVGIVAIGTLAANSLAAGGMGKDKVVHNVVHAECSLTDATDPCGDGDEATLCCDDTVDCTDDYCDETGKCMHAPNNDYCAENDDDIDCTIEECNPVRDCVNTPDDAFCDDTLACTGEETCDPATGCVAGTPVSCTAPEVCTEPDGACAEPQ